VINHLLSYCFIVLGINIWHSLPESVHSVDGRNAIKLLKMHFFTLGQHQLQI